jgi:hypothetical protein
MSSEMLDPVPNSSVSSRELTFLSAYDSHTRVFLSHATLRDKRVSVNAASSDVSAGSYVTPLTSVSP